MNRRFQFLFVSSSFAVVLLLLVGVKLGRSANNSEDPYKHFSVFSEVITRIKSDYVEEPDMKNVTLGALNGLLESIDPFASYLNADQYRQFKEMKDKSKANVGLVLSRRFGYVSVVDAVPGSPADKAGFNTGDMLETIKGISTRDMPLAYAEMLLMGDENTPVEVQVLRARKPEPEKVTLTRVKPSFPQPVLTLGGEVATFVVPSLDANLKEAVRKGLTSAMQKGAKKLVLDLRNCATGQPEEGIAVAEMFLASGAIVSVKGQRTDSQTFKAEASKQVWKQPVVVIINRGTASACEIAASALLENKRADVVGERSYGDASIRKALSLDDGSAVLLSVAKYYAASGKAIQDTGVVPNYPMNDAVAGAAEDDPDGDGVPNTTSDKPKEDTLMKKALELLNGTKTMAGIDPDAALRR